MNHLKPFLDRYTKFLNENGGTWFVGDSVSLLVIVFSHSRLRFSFLADHVGRYRRRRVHVRFGRLFQRARFGLACTTEDVQREDLLHAPAEILRFFASSDHPLNFEELHNMIDR